MSGDWSVVTSPKVHWSEGSLVRKVAGPNCNPNPYPYPNPNPNRNPIPTGAVLGKNIGGGAGPSSFGRQQRAELLCPIVQY